MPALLDIRRVCKLSLPPFPSFPPKTWKKDEERKIKEERGCSSLTFCAVFADYAAFHESALANATSVLQAQGRILGSNVKPVSIQSF